MNEQITTHPVIRRIAAGEGRPFDVAGVRLRWKARGEETQWTFSALEQVLAPGEAVAPHAHPYAEFFHILEGPVTFRQIPTSGAPQVDAVELACDVGDSILVPAGAIHAFTNAGAHQVRLLGVSTYLHQRFFDDVEEAASQGAFAALPTAEIMPAIARIGARNQMIFK